MSCTCEVTGSLIHKKPVEEIGEKKFRKQGFFIEYLDGNYSEKAKFVLLGKNAGKVDDIKVGQSITVKFKPSGRKHTKDGKDFFFQDCVAWFISSVKESDKQAPSEPFDDPDDDLPF